jgi:transcription elongation GreA/GreB family factor
MGKELNQVENADIRVLRSRIDGLKQAQSETDEDIQAGDEAQQQEGRLQHHRLTHRIQAVEDQIEEMNALLSDGPEAQDGTISIGHVVTIRIDGGETKTYILVHESGGQELSGKTTLSIRTPVGSALIGRRVNEVIPVEVGEKQLMVEVVNCDVLA